MQQRPGTGSDAQFFRTSLLLFLLLNTIAGSCNHIDDTDETFGYWEPLHYLVFGRGMQTWEYSPAYALRTYSFLLPLTAIGRLLLCFNFSQVQIFTVLRICLGGFSAVCGDS
jgi:alpha-1,2-mannosyltransferase